MTDQKTLLNELRALDFALLETGLYLNAYPSEEALAYFSKTKEAREKLSYEYEHHYGPLCLQNGVVNGSWQWTNGPWPWESEAN